MLQQRSKILRATTKTVTCHSQINKYLKKKKKNLKIMPMQYVACAIDGSVLKPSTCKSGRLNL